jgi:hypothetical protein
MKSALILLVLVAGATGKTFAFILIFLLRNYKCVFDTVIYGITITYIISQADAASSAS